MRLMSWLGSQIVLLWLSFALRWGFTAKASRPVRDWRTLMRRLNRPLIGIRSGTETGPFIYKLWRLLFVLSMVPSLILAIFTVTLIFYIAEPLYNFLEYKLMLRFLFNPDYQRDLINPTLQLLLADAQDDQRVWIMLDYSWPYLGRLRTLFSGRMQRADGSILSWRCSQRISYVEKIKRRRPTKIIKRRKFFVSVTLRIPLNHDKLQKPTAQVSAVMRDDRGCKETLRIRKHYGEIRIARRFSGKDWSIDSDFSNLLETMRTAHQLGISCLTKRAST